ncbi:MAG: cysteine--tRNA ligase, partial [Clostridiales bacterium]|nr:cysteine--tRNA ligase [Clostridiales bacterium]
IVDMFYLLVISFFMLSAHYCSPLNLSEKLVEASKNGLERILTAVEKLRDLLAEGTEEKDKKTEEGMTQEDLTHKKEVDELVAKYKAAMEDDFNTADAIAAIFELVKLSNITADEGSMEYVQYLYDTIVKLCDILGIITDKKEELLDSDIEALIEERQAARKARNFARADEIRDSLAQQGIILEDTRAGVKWKRA